MKTLTLEIITPERIVYTDSLVNYVSVPSKEGILGILPNHAPLFALLTEGELKIVKDRQEIYLSIGGGFIEVSRNKVTILVTRAVHSQEINEQETLEAKRKAEDLLKEKPSGETLTFAQNLYRRALIDLKVIRRKYKTSSFQKPTVSQN